METNESLTVTAATMIAALTSINQQQHLLVHQTDARAKFEQELQGRCATFCNAMTERITSAKDAHPMIRDAQLKQVQQAIQVWQNDVELQRRQMAAVLQVDEMDRKPFK